MNYISNLPNRIDSFFFVPTSCDEIKEVINSMKDKGNALFDIKPNIIKLICDYIAPYLCRFYNDFMCNGLYPDVLKTARVTSIFKSGNSTLVSNYRPISNSPTINKVFELLTHSRISSYIEHQKLISINQFGFKKNISTTCAIFSFVYDVLETFNKKFFTVALFLDLRKAFDSVNVDLLCLKLNMYGFRGFSIEFLRSYLNNRKQFVYVNGKSSRVDSINIGVPQRSVLGPKLFNVFINDLLSIDPGKSIFFADDGVFYVTDPDFETCIFKVNTLISRISEWLELNKLLVSLTLTKLK